MASLRELITGRDSAKEDSVRAGATAFAAEHDPEGLAPEEAGATEDSFIPDTEDEMKKNGWKMGTIPFGPGGVGMASEAEKGESLVQKLLAKGVPQEKLDAAAEALRMNGSHTFTDLTGKPVMTVGRNSQLGQELEAMGKNNVAAQAAKAPSLNYGDEVAQDATGIARMNKMRPPSGAGAASREKTGLQVIKELQAKGKK